jgi:hypothetical protein
VAESRLQELVRSRHWVEVALIVAGQHRPKELTTLSRHKDRDD